MTKEIFNITIDGKPVPEQRPRFTKYGKPYKLNSEEANAVKMLIKVSYKGKPVEGAVLVDATFYMPIPKQINKEKRRLISTGSIYHIKRPDTDNLTKFIYDCMNGIVYKDDSQIAYTRLKKIYSEQPRTEIAVSTIDQYI